MSRYNIDNYANKIALPEVFEDKELLRAKEVSGSFNRKHYSYSFLSSWNSCPAKTILSCLVKRDSPALSIGTCVHKLLEEHYLSETQDKEKTLKSANKVDLDPFYVCEVKEYLNSYFNIKPYKDLHNVTYITEELIEGNPKPLGVSLPTSLKGCIDRIDISDEGVFIIDYKTSSRAYSEDQYLNQMLLYKWLVEDDWGVPIDEIYVAHLYKNNPRYILQKHTLKTQSMLIDKIFDIDEEVKKSIPERVYLKRKGFHCKWCPFSNYCDVSKVIFNSETNEFEER